MIPVFSVDEEKWVLQALVHGGSIADSAEGTIAAVNNNVSVTMRLSPITRNNGSNFVGCWEVPVASIAVIVCCELDRDAVTVDPLKHLHGVLENVRPAMIPEDQVLQALHNDRVECSISLHPVPQGLTWVVYVKLCVRGMVSVTWEKGSELMVELAMDAECWRSSPTHVDTVVNLNSKRCECEGRVILTDVLTESVGLWCCPCE